MCERLWEALVCRLLGLPGRTSGGSQRAGRSAPCSLCGGHARGRHARGRHARGGHAGSVLGAGGRQRQRSTDPSPLAPRRLGSCPPQGCLTQPPAPSAGSPVVGPAPPRASLHRGPRPLPAPAFWAPLLGVKLAPPTGQALDGALGSPHPQQLRPQRAVCPLPLTALASSPRF